MVYKRAAKLYVNVLYIHYTRQNLTVKKGSTNSFEYILPFPQLIKCENVDRIHYLFSRCYRDPYTCPNHFSLRLSLQFICSTHSSI